LGCVRSLGTWGGHASGTLRGGVDGLRKGEKGANRGKEGVVGGGRFLYGREVGNLVLGLKALGGEGKGGVLPKGGGARRGGEWTKIGLTGAI